MGLFDFIGKYAHIPMTFIALGEGIVFCLKIREERKKKMEERKSCQNVLNRQKVSLHGIVRDINALGDQIILKSTKSVMLNKIKEIKDELELTLRLGILFSSLDENELSPNIGYFLSQDISYFNDRKGKVDRETFESVKRRLKGIKELESKFLIDLIDKLLIKLDTQALNSPKPTA